MADFTLPRYFVESANARGANESFVEFPLLHVVDVFFVGNRHLEPREWAVAVDAAGDLRVVPRENRGALCESLQNELTFNEISGGRPARLIEATKIYLFGLQVIEQVCAASPGLNDPVYLYGTLYEFENGGARANGQLTVTRGDLLDAIVAGANSAFRCNETIGNQFSRCFQLMLPADTEDEIRRGVGIVLAYPLFPVELLATSAANEIIVSQLIYDLLGNLKEDLKREQVKHPLTSMILPVPNRLELERELEAQGYEIEGDAAIKKSVSSSGFKGLLASVFGSLTRDELRLPPRGTIEEFLALARQTLDSLQKDLLTNRAAALRDCVKAAPTNYRRTPAPALFAKTMSPNSVSPNLPPVRAAARKIEISNDQPPDWMRDFISADKARDSKSKFTSTLKIKPPIISAAESEKKKRKEWQQDFAEISKQTLNNDEKKTLTKNKPDWMRDFE